MKKISEYLRWADDQPYFAFFNGNEMDNPMGCFPTILFAGGMHSIVSPAENFFNHLDALTKRNPQWLAGYLGYDLKNQLEDLESNNQDLHDSPEAFFFQPESVLQWSEEGVTTLVGPSPDISSQTIKDSAPIVSGTLKLMPSLSKKAYIEKIIALKDHILHGDIYEVNFCMAFSIENIVIDPVAIYLALNKRSPAPFSSLIKAQGQYVISSSPERFLKKSGRTLISQPIKGTMRRGKTTKEDQALANKLRNSEKERAENMMIVDLVRNDLSRVSDTGSVRVDEMFGIYSFATVHQMISTVSSTLGSNYSAVDALRYAFPMGSMTGAPKIKAMGLIDAYETTKRGIFSGAAGFISPENDFDFSVLIRTMVYSPDKKLLTFHVGSAITYDSEPESEYQECLLKAKALCEVLGITPLT